MKDLGYVVVFVLALLSLWLWAQGHSDLQRAICPQPVVAGGRTLSCNGSATVHLPDGTTAVVTTPPPGTPSAAHPRR